MMEPAWLLLLLPVAAASGWYMGARERKDSGQGRPQIPEAYFKGLNLLLNEQPDKALQVFLQAAELDEDTVEMHIALGNLFRRRGEIERATSIHQNLVERSDLDDSLRSLALYELAQDYFKAGLFDRSESLFQELRQLPDFREQACQFLLQIYDQEKEWHSAIVIGEELSDIARHDYSETLAQYCCELADLALAEGKAGKAEYYLESAFRHDAKCVRAAILSGRVAAFRGNHGGAIAIWRGLERWAPEALGEVVELVSRSYAELNDEPGFRGFLESALEKNPDARIVSSLVEMSRNRSGGLASTQILLDIVRKYPSLEGLYQLLRNRNATELFKGESIDIELIARLLSEAMGHAREYHCRRCGFSSSTMHWQCPGCKAWGSVQKRLFGRERGEFPGQGKLPT
jgi:lipopolysaccharide biosynthesis regulator YciM